MNTPTYIVVMIKRGRETRIAEGLESMAEAAKVAYRLTRSCWEEWSTEPDHTFCARRD